MEVHPAVPHLPTLPPPEAPMQRSPAVPTPPAPHSPPAAPAAAWPPPPSRIACGDGCAPCGALGGRARAWRVRLAVRTVPVWVGGMLWWACMIDEGGAHTEALRRNRRSHQPPPKPLASQAPILSSPHLLRRPPRRTSPRSQWTSATRRTTIRVQVLSSQPTRPCRRKPSGAMRRLAMSAHARRLVARLARVSPPTPFSTLGTQPPKTTLPRPPQGLGPRALAGARQHPPPRLRPRPFPVDVCMWASRMGALGGRARAWRVRFGT